jgi:hypothetical protein
MRGRIQDAYRDWRDYAPVSTDPTDWISLQPNIQVLMQRQTRMRAAKALLRQAQHVKLAGGTVRVRVEFADTTDLTVPSTIPLVVHTPAGVVFSSYGHSSVTVNGDTTIVEAHAPGRERYVGFMPFPSMTMVRSNDETDPVRVQQDTRIRLIRGFNPERIP